MATQQFLEVDVDGELKKIISKLNNFDDQIASPTILAKALTTAARRANTRLKKDVLKRYAIQDKSILSNTADGGTKVVAATASTVEAIIETSGTMLDVMEFEAEGNTKTKAASAKVLSSGSLKMLEISGRKAFLTKFESGHQAIVQRNTTTSLPTKKITGPSLPMMFGHEDVQDPAKEVAFNYLTSEIEKNIQKVLSK